MSPKSGDPRAKEPTGDSQIRHLVTQSALLLSSGLFGYIGGFGLTFLLTHSLAPSVFGIYVVAWGIAQTVAALGLMGADWIMFRQGSYYHSVGDIPRLRATAHFALSMSGSALTLLGLGLFLLAPYLGNSVFHQPSIVPLIRIAALLGPVIGVGQTMLYATQAFGTIRDLALVRNLLQPVVRLAAAAIAVGLAPTALSAMTGIVIADTLLTISAALLLNRRMGLFGTTDSIHRGQLIRFALPVWGSKVIETTRGQMFPILLGSIGKSFGNSGAFAVGRRIVAAPGSVIASLNQVYSPQASRLFLRDRRDDLAVLFKSMGKWSFTLAFPLFCLTVAFPKQVLSVFGPGFSSSSTALVVLAVAMMFNFASGPVTTTLIVIGRSSLALIDYVIVLAAELGLAFLLIPRHGLIGAAIARLVGTALNNLVPMAQVWWSARVHPYRLDYWKPVAAGSIAALAALVVVRISGLGVTPLAALVAAAVIGSTYVALLLVFGLTQEDRVAIDALLRRARRSGPDGTPAPAQDLPEAEDTAAE
jgi:O-antigen/teichoic acid export membrane protein